MNRILKVLAVLTALVGVPALAHEKGGNAMGTVESVTPERIVVKTSDGHPVAYEITKQTRFLKGEKPARLEDVRVGQRVAVHGTSAGETLQALQVKLGSQAARR